ncbi:hypothetical protein [Yoonia sp.]|uniref:hypothetical protein n=1 Tax=Yoonia sp. TaxID=2212373 RepID=UPI0025CCD056|nr:hypothetical protein [Yoonia sp.]
MSTLLRILKSAPQDLWLDTIRRAKPRVHDELVFWMLNQTECDFAVAAHAFYHSDPAHYLDDPRPLPPHPAPGQTFAQVLINWDKGYYRTHKLQLELRDVHPRTVAGLNQKSMARPRGSLPFAIPARFLDPWGGKPIALPPYLSPDDAIHLWPIYAALQLRVPDDPPGLPRQIAKARKAIGLFSFRTRRS